MKTGILLLSLAGMSVSLADYDLVVEIPAIKTAEYHKPYVASWVEDEGRKHMSNVALWYEINNRKNEGEKWLKDIRKWWRASGRSLDMPVEGLSSPTKPPGTHKISLKKILADLPADPSKTYKLYVEAAREVGGRELLAIDFKWDGKQVTFVDQSDKAGTSELGKVSMVKHEESAQESAKSE